MRGYGIPPWYTGYGWRRGDTVQASEMRVSDAERHEVAETLSRHYAEGRLDQAEFDERMSTAMGAKTRGDLAGLLRDLPHLSDVAPDRPPSRRRRASRTLLLALGVLLLVTWTTSWMWPPFYWHGPFGHPHFGFLLLALVVFVVLRRRRRGWAYHGEAPPPARW